MLLLALCFILCFINGYIKLSLNNSYCIFLFGFYKDLKCYFSVLLSIKDNKF